MKEAALLGLMSVFLLTACGGGDGDSKESEPEPKKISANGLYIHPDNLNFMIVDTRRDTAPVMGLSIPNQDLFQVFTVDSEADGKLNGRGLLLLDGINNSNSVYDEEQQMTVTFDADSAEIYGLVKSGLYSYSYDRAADSISLDKLAGYYTSGGAELSIESDGRFTVSDEAGCILEGTLAYKDYYYEGINSVLSNCGTTNNNDYHVVVVSAHLNGKDRVVLTHFRFEYPSYAFGSGVFD